MYPTAEVPGPGYRQIFLMMAFQRVGLTMGMDFADPYPISNIVVVTHMKRTRF
ncbi:unnamed protein product [Nesidiocoris tenuis]|uniref:Uncharacterized protein n=1 Tax=Nesidiocoris tenuis TaxID=355587 RepID=A0A6H5G2E4_9HEMI|nr:unnamed protein product [Nesidiocoris tenuis]CAB0009698.1 unnamed protein product [Nesidiocoris tenuis]